MSAQGRLHALDAFRGIAAIWVVLFHLILRFPAFMQGRPLTMQDTTFGIPSGFFSAMPVLWFFLISGFVITWTIDRSRTPMDFVVSRVSRIYPAYWTAIAVTLAIAAVWPLPGLAPTPGQVLVNLTMLQAYAGVPDVAGVFWSLAIELLFYIYALALFASGQWRRVHWVAAAWAVVALAAAMADQLGRPVPWRVTQVLLLAYAPFLAAGMMLYRLWRGQTPLWCVATLVVCALATLAGQGPLVTLVAAAAAGLMFWATKGGLRWLAWGPLLWLGAISYSLYLSHEHAGYVAILTLERAGAPRWAATLGALAAVLALASVITWTIERPAMHAIRRLWTRPRATPPPAVTGGGAAAPAERPAAPGSRG